MAALNDAVSSAAPVAPTSPVSSVGSLPGSDRSLSAASLVASVTAQAAARGGAPRRPVIIWDTETTGLSALKNNIVEIALEELGQHDGAPVYHFASLVHPEGVTMPRAATRVHGITNAMMRDSPTFAQVWPDLAEYVRDVSGTRGRPIFVAHNLGFDLRFLREELARIGETFPPWDFACSLRDVAHVLWPGQPGSLAALAARFGVVNEEAHRALCDVRATATVLHKADEWLAAQAAATGTPVDAVAHGERVRALLDAAARKRREGIHGAALAAQMDAEDDARSSNGVLVSDSNVVEMRESMDSDEKNDAENVVMEEVSSESEDEEEDDDNEFRYHYVSSSTIFHNSRSCITLESSTTFHSAERPPAGRRLCRHCADKWREDTPDSEVVTGTDAPTEEASSPVVAQNGNDVSMRSAMDTATARGSDVTMKSAQAESPRRLADKVESWFIAPTGRLYHRSRACGNLDLARTIHRIDRVPERRYACSICVGKK